ncbi:MAG: dethiobiotin synthase [Desulfobacteraceae bacterium]
MKPIPDISVVGTDTGVGKTVVSLLLMQRLYARGYHPFYLKPFQTGCATPYDADSDAAFVYRHTAPLSRKDPGQSVVYCLPNPKAPYFAARDAGMTIHLEKVLQAMETRRSTHSPLIVEAAGGLLVPITERHTVLDLLSQTNCRPLLVARAGLGTINHTLLSIEALIKRKISPLGVILAQSDDCTDPLHLVKENMEAIHMFSGIQVAGVVPMLADYSAPPDKAYQALEALEFSAP